jgi:heptosyltransferase-2
MLDSTDRVVSYDCRFFLGDRPCVWHKSEGAICQCTHYEPVSGCILIVKLDAMGDMLRTTCLLPDLAEAHPGAAFVWVTGPESVPLLENNPYLTEVIAYGPDSLVQLAARQFDRVINLDAGKTSCALATLARADVKSGFVLDSKGCVKPTCAAAETWLKMGVFDDLKKQNSRTYQEIMCAILDIPETNLRYVLHLTDEERTRAKEHLADLGVSLDKPVIGLNTGGGGRWALKQWREDAFVELIDRLHEEHGSAVQILLLGGTAEKERNQRIAPRASSPVVDTGSDNEVRHFASLVSHCDVVVSGDTLAMHIAIALGRRVVVLFGPTSAAEIELFGLGRKVVPDMECLVCYKTDCDFVPNCMQLITVDMVLDAVSAELSKSLAAA